MRTSPRLWTSVLITLALAAGPSRAQEEPPPESDWRDEIRALYEKAKEAGETGADNATEWVAEDFRRMAAWEYKVVRVAASSDDSLEEQLNLLGEERWECFEVVVVKGETVLFLKRPAKSYLKAIPVSQLLKLLPRGDGEE